MITLRLHILQKYLVRQFIPVCLVALFFFVLLLQLADLFTNLWKYLANEVSPTSVLKVMWLYIPKCISFALPIAVLFASSYTMGTLYARNELTSIFSAGYPLYKLVTPLLVLGLFFSILMFFFEDRIVIHSQAQKNALNRTLTDPEQSFSNTNLVILSRDDTTVYFADYYQDTEQRLYNVFVVLRNKEGSLRTVIQGSLANWINDEWILESPYRYDFNADGSVTTGSSLSGMILDEPPETFRRHVLSIEELTASQAKEYIAFIRRAGIPHTEHLTDYYKRFSFPFTIFIVLFFSISLGGRFKKNILLMSLLTSLVIAVSFYVTQMMTVLLAKWEYISPVSGAWLPVLIFIAGSIAILRHART